jgi:hypothetical protein
MIVDVMGANGAGKSTLMREFLEKNGATPKYELGLSMALGYEGRYGHRSFFVLGDYTTPCGGSERVRPQIVLKQRIIWAAGVAPVRPDRLRVGNCG